MRKLTMEEFIERVKIIHPNYDFSHATYINSHEKVKVICKDHGSFFSSPNALLCGKGCKLCSVAYNAKNLSLTKNEFIERAKKIHPNYDFSMVVYKNCNVRVKIICPSHGLFETFPSNLLKGCKCRKCYNDTIGSKFSSNTYEFIERAKKIHPNYNFSLVNYKNCKTKVKIICPSHGIFEIRPSELLQGNRCSKCTKNRKYTTIEFIEMIQKHHPNYDFSMFVYTNNKGKGIVICDKHGEFIATPSNLLKGHGCPNCKRSKGEEFIAKWLEKNVLEFTPQKKFPSCKDKLELPFDFYINNTNILIEYDGIQHFKPLPWRGGSEAFEYIKKHDLIKNNWAELNNYKIIRLDYKMKLKEKISILESIKSNIKQKETI